MKHLPTWLAFALTLAPIGSRSAEWHNVILFVPDGLRSQIVDAATAPTFARVRDEGVNFANSHSLFPTFTTANASAFSTGHKLGDTGDYSNDIYSRFAIKSSGNTVTPFLESDPVLRELNEDFGHNYLNEDSIVALARGAGHSTALIGKLGPVAIFDLDSMDEHGAASRTLILDDASGQTYGVPLPAEWKQAFDSAGVPLIAPSRGENGNPGTFEKPGTLSPNTVQQQYFLDAVLKVVLPEFKKAHRPFVLVYWSRDPDGTQHYQGDSFRTLDPGINGPTSQAAIRSADSALAAIESKLKELNLFEATDIIVSADHGFSTIDKGSATSPAAARNYDDVVKGQLPVGFLAIDLTLGLQKSDPHLRLFDPDKGNAPVDFTHRAHPSKGNGLIGRDPSAPQVIVASNGGSDLIYLADNLPPTETAELGRRVTSTLLEQDYVSGLFVDEKRLGKVAGALSLESIGLAGEALTPRPAIVVNFRSFSTGCDRPVLCTVEIADTFLQEGQGMHGSFSRADTWNFMAARGPDFKPGYVDPLPASNADMGITIARLLKLSLHPKGPLNGRVLEEALRGSHDATFPIRVGRIESAPAQKGLKTILRTQSIPGYTYFDAAGFAGRTVGLEEK